MARKASIDVERAMEMLREGQSTQAVAEHFGVSRQAIDLHRRKLIREGQLADRRAPRAMVYNAAAPARPASKQERPLKAQGSGAREAAPVPLDRLIELAIDAFGSLKKVPQLEAELARCRQDYEKASRRIRELEQELARRMEQEARWKLAVTGDSLPPPKGTQQ